MILKSIKLGKKKFVANRAIFYFMKDKIINEYLKINLIQYNLIFKCNIFLCRN